MPQAFAHKLLGVPPDQRRKAARDGAGWGFEFERNFEFGAASIRSVVEADHAAVLEHLLVRCPGHVFAGPVVGDLDPRLDIDSGRLPNGEPQAASTTAFELKDMQKLVPILWVTHKVINLLWIFINGDAYPHSALIRPAKIGDAAIDQIPTAAGE